MATAQQDDWTPQQAAEQGLGWVPKNHPLYGTAGFVGAPAGGAAGDQVMNGQPAPTYTAPPNPPPVSAVAPSAAPAAPSSPDPFAALGGGVFQDGGWLPPGHPLIRAGGGAAAPGAAPGAVPGAPAAGQTPEGQAAAASTYSTTPGAAPLNNTTNQGTQDVVRNSLLDRATQGTTVDTNDANFRQQADAFAGAQERQRRQELESIAQDNFASGTRGSGAEALERRIAGETAARNVGGFEAQLVGQELQSRREEIASALESLRGQISTDQQLALQRELAGLDAAIKRESLAQSGSLGSQDLSLRDKLGTGALNVDLLRALLSNQQFDKGLGVDIGKYETDSYFRSLGL